MKKEMIFAGLEARMENKVVQMTREERAIWAFVQRFYDAAREIGSTLGYFRLFREHFALHILLVWSRTKAMVRPIARALNESNHVYAGCDSVDMMTAAACALFHDCGMGFAAPEAAADGETIRKQHALRSALAVCRKDSYTFLQSLGICSEVVAVVCYLHSKSCSGVRNLADTQEYLSAVNRLEEAVETANAADGEFSFNKGLALLFHRQCRTLAAVIRETNAAAHDADSAVTMAGEEIVVIHDDGVSHVYVGGREVVDRKRRISRPQPYNKNAGE